VIGMTSALALLRLFPRLRLLEVLGAYSFTVYLFHPFFVGASRTALKLILQPSTEALFAVGLLAGLAGPPILERTLGRFPLANRWLFGQSDSGHHNELPRPAVWGSR
jgi:fucose 4-O-acetylase-like acetyltransferase